MINIVIPLLLVAIALVHGSNVVTVTDASFKEEVLKHPGIVIVEFYAPWCGHCKSLAPEYEKAASTLNGVVKLVAVDATVHETVARKYAIQGFPTLKVFGADKKNPVDYQGQRTADAIVTEAMKAANQLVKDRKKGKASGSTEKPKSGSGSGSSASKKGSDVVELTEANFNALVMDSPDHWLVEFYAPWCGHCKNLAPEWETAAKDLKGSVRLGAVDATVHGSLAQQYGVKGYPTIKIFPAGPKKNAQEYKGPREAAGIVQYALQTLDAAGGASISIPQIVDEASFQEVCGQSGKFCAILFVPHIYDSSAKARNAYIDTVISVAKSHRGTPLRFAWTEGMAQESLESALVVNNAYPTLSILSLEKKIYATQRVSWSEKNLKTFVNGVLGNSEKKFSLTATPSIVKVSAWDGKDATMPVEEPLDMDF